MEARAPPRFPVTERRFTVSDVEAQPSSGTRRTRDTLFSSVPLLAGLSGRQIKKLARAANEDRYDRGTVILREGGRTSSLFVIAEGTAKVVRGGRTVARRSAGEFFGEISMIDLRPRTATITAETPMVCLVLQQRMLRELVAGDSTMAWSLLQTLAGRVRDD
jgi:CRP-like cAMP-binding protein